MASPLKRARGLGAAKDGVGHWWSQRLTAVALIPLLLWLTASLITLAGSDYSAFLAWLEAPLTAGLMILLLIALFHHTVLGLQVIIEDYINSDMVRFAMIMLLQLAGFALAIVGILATLYIALGV